MPSFHRYLAISLGISSFVLQALGIPSMLAAARLASQAVNVANGSVTHHALVTGGRGPLGGDGRRIQQAAARLLNSSRPFNVVAIGGSPTAYQKGLPSYHDFIEKALNKAAPLPKRTFHSVKNFGFSGTNACLFAYKADLFATLLDHKVDLIIFENNINSSSQHERHLDGTIPRCLEALLRTFVSVSPNAAVVLLDLNKCGPSSERGGIGNMNGETADDVARELMAAVQELPRVGACDDGCTLSSVTNALVRATQSADPRAQRRPSAATLLGATYLHQIVASCLSMAEVSVAHALAQSLDATMKRSHRLPEIFDDFQNKPLRELGFNASTTSKCLCQSDSVHPGITGHRIAAALVLQTLSRSLFLWNDTSSGREHHALSCLGKSGNAAGVRIYQDTDPFFGTVEQLSRLHPIALVFV